MLPECKEVCEECANDRHVFHILNEAAIDLWKLLDNIDTADDWAVISRGNTK